MWEYGNKVTYFWENGKVKSSATNGLVVLTNYTAFKYYDEKTNSFVDLNENENIDFISSSYNYYPTTLTESSSGAIKGLETDSLEYDLLFTLNYWLSSRFIGTGEGRLGLGLFQINNKRLYDDNLYETNNREISRTFGVRPIVVLGGNTK